MGTAVETGNLKYWVYVSSHTNWSEIVFTLKVNQTFLAIRVKNSSAARAEAFLPNLNNKIEPTSSRPSATNATPNRVKPRLQAGSPRLPAAAIRKRRKQQDHRAQPDHPLAPTSTPAEENSCSNKVAVATSRAAKLTSK